MQPVLRSQGTGFYFELLQRIRERKRQIQRVERVVVESPIQNERNTGEKPSPDRNEAPARHSRRTGLPGRYGSSGKLNQFNRISSIKRQLENSRIFDNGSDARRLQLNQ